MKFYLKSCLARFIRDQKKSYWILGMCMPLFLNLDGYTQNRDSLDKYLDIFENTHQDSLKANAGNELSWYYSEIDSAKAYKYAYLAKELAEKKGIKIEEATSWTRIGQVHEFHGFYAKALIAYRKAMRIDEEINPPHLYGVARGNFNLGNISGKLGKYDKATDYLERSIQLFIQCGDAGLYALASAYNQIGINYDKLGRKEEALDHYNGCIRTAEIANNRYAFIDAKINIGIVYKSQKRYDQALAMFNDGLEASKEIGNENRIAKCYNNIGSVFIDQGELKAAESHFKRVLELEAERVEASSKIIARQYLSYYYELTGNYDKALVQNLDLLPLLEPEKIPEELLTTHLAIGRIYYEQKKYENSLKHLQKAFDIGETSALIPIKLEISKYLSAVYQKLNLSYEALIQLNISHALKDSVYEFQRKSLAYEANVNRIKQLETENQIQSLKLYSSITLAILTLLASIFLLSWYGAKQKQMIAENKVQMMQDRIEIMLKEEELRTIHARLDGQEKERNRIAQDLHDSLGALLSMVKIHFQSLGNQLSELRFPKTEQYNKANELLDRSIVEVRKISHDIGDNYLMDFGLVAALKDLGNVLEENNNLKVQILAIDFEERLEFKKEVSIYKIVLSLISNILKHAEATHVTIQLIRHDKSIIITVEDNGKGFDPSEFIAGKGGMGYKSIKSRLLNLGGDIIVDSGKGVGTTISLEIPINKIEI